MEKLQVIKHPQFGQLSLIKLDNKEFFKAKEVALMLGYKNINDAIARHCKGVVKHDLPTKSGVQEINLIPEGDVWRLIIRSKLPQAEAIEKWIMDEVLPTIRKTGSYNSKVVEEKMYEYFNKTYKGIPVLSTSDVSHFTGLNIATIDYHLRTNAKRDIDYFYVDGENLKKYKEENPQASKLSSTVNLITQKGFNLICRLSGIKIETPLCFNVPKAEQLTLQPEKKSYLQKVFDEMRKHYNISTHILSKESAEMLKVRNTLNEEITLKQEDTYHIFVDGTAPKPEKDFLFAQGLGRIITGQLREGANENIDYQQEARLFAIVLTALSLYFET